MTYSFGTAAGGDEPQLSEIGKTALSYARLGIPVFPIDPRNKRPLVRRGFYAATTNLATITEWWTTWPNAMIGVPTGQPSGIIVLDIDVKLGVDGRASLLALEAIHGPLPNTMIVRTPSGGEHHWFRAPAHWIKNSVSKIGPGLDIRGDGGYVIAPGSISAAGGKYELVGNGSVVPAPQWFLDLIKAPPPGPLPLQATNIVEFPLTGISPGVNPVQGRSERYAAAAMEDEVAKVARAATGTRNAALNRAAFALGQLVSAGALDEAGVTSALLAAATQNGLVRDDGEAAVAATLLSGLGAGKQQPRTLPAAVLRPSELEVIEGGQDAAEAEGNWRERLVTNRTQGALPNLANALLALREDPIFEGILAYDEIARATVMMRAIERQDGAPAMRGEFPRQVTDEEVGAIQEWLQTNGIPKLANNVVHQAVELRAKENSFHPVRQYLESLKWDGVARVESWLHDYLKAEATPYTAGIGRMFLIALVARPMHPGCKVDYMLILEGAQGIGKSKVCAILADRWYSDSLPHQLTGKDASQHLRNKWLIEMGEIPHLKSEVNDLKAFLTRTEERYRPPYARSEVVEPRQCVLIGTTNKSEYLRDDTGARRFWPVQAGVRGELEIEGLRRDRDQLLAEAVHLFQGGAKCWPDRVFEAEHARPEQERRYEADAWEEKVASYLEGKVRTTVGEVALIGLGIETARQGVPEQRRIASILRRLDWESQRTAEVRYWARQRIVSEAGDSG